MENELVQQLHAHHGHGSHHWQTVVLAGPEFSTLLLHHKLNITWVFVGGQYTLK